MAEGPLFPSTLWQDDAAYFQSLWIQWQYPVQRLEEVQAKTRVRSCGDGGDGVY